MKKTAAKMMILLGILVVVLVATTMVEIAVDQLTYQKRDLRHLFKHSLGNVGTMLVFLSVAGYMIKKRYRQFPGKAKDWLDIHEFLAVVGVFMVGIHTGAHLSAFVPTMTLAITIACLVSGFVGRGIYNQARKELAEKKGELLKKGMPPEQVEEELAMAASAAKTLAKWRDTHRPLSLALVLALALHIISVLFFGG
ncbi:MAG: hypothetical protein OEZ04_13735 [Nitrospinota bacterium]|nr:hypothetical protein [Nitrospinota bacterium]